METILDFFINTVGGGSLINAIGIVVVLVAMIVATYAVVRFGLNEKIAEFTKKLAMLDDVITDIIMAVAYNDALDFDAAQKEAAELAEGEEPYIIDYRMLYVVREVQRYAEKQWNLKLDLVFIHRRAEKLFRMLRHSPTNGIDI